MDEALQVSLAALETEDRAAALPSGCEHTALWCLSQLPPLYAKYRNTSESRYGDEITRLVQGMVKGLAEGQRGSPAGPQLGGLIAEKLRLLHEEFGLPGLQIKMPTTPTPRARTA